MARVSKEIKDKIEEYVNQIPFKKMNKCGTCTETLTHFTKQCEIETGGPTATITKYMSERINETAAPLDRVDGKQLQDKVRYHEGKDKIGISDNKSNSEYNWRIIPESSLRKRKAHVSQNTTENEWYTPPEFIKAAHLTMGGIDLDPASSVVANEIVMAKHFYTKENDGLVQPWAGKIWLNPPYVQPLISQFLEKLCAERANIQEAITLFNNATETKWFQSTAIMGSAICFPLRRIRFLDPDGNPGAPLQGQAIVYIGDNKKAFVENFNQFGLILYV